MDAKSEQQSLKNEPLPEVRIENPLSYVWELDTQIATINESLSELMRLRNEALDYAVRNNISEDSRCKLDEKRRKTRILNIDKFKSVFPDEYNMCCERERKEKEEALNNIGKKINLTLVDALVNKTALAAAPGVVTVKESISYGVVLK